MLKFNSKILNLGTVLLILYIFYYNYANKPPIIQNNMYTTTKSCKTNKSYRVEFDPKKSYNDYSLKEKIIYFFYKDKIEEARNIVNDRKK